MQRLHGGDRMTGLTQIHLDALEDLSPGILAWADSAWRRNAAHEARPHTSETINALLRRGLAETSSDNIVITVTGVKTRAELSRRIGNVQRLRAAVSPEAHHVR